MFRQLLSKQCGDLSAAQLDLLEKHYDLLVRWNSRLNLTRIVRPEEVVQLHYCESIYLARKLPEGCLRIADVGSGAGFPGIPVAILRPECYVTLVESHRRKAVFLREASRGLQNVEIASCRAESLTGRFDWVISRAVEPSAVISLKLASKMAILMSGTDLGKLPKSDSVSNVPHGKNRVIAMFHVERDNMS